MADGAFHTRLADGTIVPSEVLINMANKSTYKVPEELKGTYMRLNTLTHEEARERMEFLVTKKYGLLQEV